MAWIVKRKRKDGTPVLRVAWRDRQTGKPQSETFLGTQELAAKSFLRDVEAAGNAWPEGWVPGQGYPPPSPNPSGYDVRKACLKAVQVNRRANPGTKADYEREINRYLPEGDPLAAMFVENVTIQAIEDWHSRLALMMTQPGGPAKSKRTTEFTPQPLSAKTRRNAHSRLSAGLALMVRYGHISSNPAVGLGPGRVRTKKQQALSPKEFQALLGYVAEHYRPFVETLGRTGMRFSEATALTTRRLALHENPPTIYVEEAWKRTEQYARYVKGETKSEAGTRTVPIDAALATMLQALVRGKAASDHVFVTEWGNVMRHNNFHSRFWRPAALGAYRDGAISFVPTIHDLRHAHASWLLMSGIPVLAVADRLGHDPAVLLRDYAHLIGQARNAAPAAISELFPGDASKGPAGSQPSG